MSVLYIPKNENYPICKHCSNLFTLQIQITLNELPNEFVEKHFQEALKEGNLKLKRNWYFVQMKSKIINVISRNLVKIKLTFILANFNCF